MVKIILFQKVSFLYYNKLLSIDLSHNILAKYVYNDNEKIRKTLINLLFIYRKVINKIKYMYFMRFRRQVLMKVHNNEKNKNKVFDRLFNYIKIKKEKINKLSQKLLLNESKKYTYFPKINKYNLIFSKFNQSFNNNNNYKFNNDKNNLNIVNNKNINYLNILNDYNKNEKKKSNSYVKYNLSEKEEKSNKTFNIYNNDLLNYKNKIPIPSSIDNIKYSKTYRNLNNKISIKKAKNKESSLSKKYTYQNSSYNEDISKGNNSFGNNLHKKNNNILSFLYSDSTSLISTNDYHISKSVFSSIIPDNSTPINESFFNIKNNIQNNDINKANDIYFNINCQRIKNKHKINSIPKNKKFLSNELKSISQNKNPINSAINKSINNKNNLLVPSEINSICFSFNNDNRNKNNKYYKKISIKKPCYNKFKKIKIFKKLNIGKNFKLISDGYKPNNKNFNKKKLNLKIDSSNLYDKNNSIEFINGKNKYELNSQLEPISTTMQSLSDEKIFEMTNFYINKEEIVDKMLINNILTSRRK